MIKLLTRIVILLTFALGVLLAIGYYAGPKTKYYSITGTYGPAMAEKFKKFITKTREGDKVILHIESPGGLVLSLNKILHYLHKSKANVSCYVDSHAMSAAAITLMHCDRVYATDKSVILFHMFQVCKAQFGNMCVARRAVSAKHEPEMYKESVRMLQVAKYVLTKKQWNDLLNGADVAISGKVLMERLRGLK